MPRRTCRNPAIFLAACVLAFGLTGVASAAPITHPADSYEQDDTASQAHDVTGHFDPGQAWFGGDLYTRSHTFDSVDDAAVTADEDWVKITVPADYDYFGYSYLIEAVRGDEAGGQVTQVDPVIEVYGPGIPATWTAPGDLGESATVPGVTETDPLAIAAGDDGEWFEGRGATVSFIPNAAGTYYVRVRPFYMYSEGDTPGFRDGVGDYTLRLKIGQMTRVAGPDRIQTAVAISKERFRSGESDYAVIASGYSFPDALSGSTLAGALQAPMLLTRATSLPGAVETELTRLGVSEVYLLGGTGAVSSAVESRLNTLLGSSSVHRIAGTGRIQTAAAVAKEADLITGVAKVAFVANGYTYPDALSASPMAAHNVAPILLTRQGTLANTTKQAIIDLGITDVVIVGGTGAVSEYVETQLRTLLGGSPHVKRIGGSTRYETSSEFAIWATAATGGGPSVGTPGSPSALSALDYDRIGIASGQNYPDALAGGVFCGLGAAPVLLSPAATWSSYIHDYNPAEAPNPSRTYYSAGSLAILRSYVMGGEGALSDWVYLSGDLLTGPALD